MNAPVPTIPHHSLLVFLLQLAVLLLLALSLGQLAARFKMPAIVGELLAGVLVGPSVLSHAWPALADWLMPKDTAQMHMLDAVGQVGVVLLVGITGMELKFDLVRRRRLTAARVSVCGLVLPLALGVGVGFLLPSSIRPDGTSPTVFAIFLGVALCVTAIPVIAKTLMDMNLLHRDIGQLTLAAGVLDDVVGWFLLSIVSAMATAGLSTGTVATSLLYPVGVVLAAWVVGRPLVKAALRAAGRSASPVPTVAVTALTVLLGAAATQALHLEAVFGAFVCGALIGTSGQLDREKLAPLRTTVLAFLAPVFFATAGIRMDLTALTDPTVLAAACAVLAVAIIGKFAGAFAGAKMSGLGRWEGLALGAGMNSRGVIEVVVAMVGLQLGVLSAEAYTIVILVAIVTSLMAPPVLRVAMARIDEDAEAGMGMAGTAPRDLAAPPSASV
ncbi:cation:proton antiporter [Streptomyces albogriseolus]|uniref:cation:proton antiporter n=1 Tax=Streptomyces albogriseolus TaxID=1887 RepID=UPI00379D0EAB